MRKDENRAPTRGQVQRQACRGPGGGAVEEHAPVMYLRYRYHHVPACPGATVMIVFSSWIMMIDGRAEWQTSHGFRSDLLYASASSLSGILTPTAENAFDAFSPGSSTRISRPSMEHIRDWAYPASS